jgi:hypothetical protein
MNETKPKLVIEGLDMGRIVSRDIERIYLSRKSGKVIVLTYSQNGSVRSQLINSILSVRSGLEMRNFDDSEY